MHSLFVSGGPISVVNYSKNLRSGPWLLKNLALQKLDSSEFTWGPNGSKIVTITAREWQDEFIDSENPYQALKRAAKALQDLIVTFDNFEEKIQFFEEIVYRNKSGMVELHFSSKLQLAMIIG